MKCLLMCAAVLLLESASAPCDQAKEPPSKSGRVPAGTAKPPAPRVPSAKGGGIPKAPQTPQKGPPVFQRVPGAQVQRFLRLTPQEREIAIDKMPVAAQESIRRSLAAFDSLPAQERERRLRLFEAVSRLPKDKQDLINQRINEFQQLPQDRKLGIRRAYQLLSGKPEEDRRTIIDSQEFKDRFTPGEQQIIVDLVKYYRSPEP